MDYYIDSRTGSNENAGTSEDQAWQDFSPVNDTDLAPGDRLLLKRGSHIRQQLRVGAVGEPGNRITITAYGSGPRPVVEGDPHRACEEIHQRGSLDPAALYTHAGGCFEQVRIYTRPRTADTSPHSLGGSLKDLRLYNRLLCPKEIARLASP